MLAAPVLFAAAELIGKGLVPPAAAIGSMTGTGSSPPPM